MPHQTITPKTAAGVAAAVRTVSRAWHLETDCSHHARTVLPWFTRLSWALLLFLWSVSVHPVGAMVHEIQFLGAFVTPMGSDTPRTLAQCPISTFFGASETSPSLTLTCC